MTDTQVRERPVGSSRPGRTSGGGLSRDAVENRVLSVARWVVIAVLLLVTLFPFWYMLILSVRSLDSVLQDPGALQGAVEGARGRRRVGPVGEALRRQGDAAGLEAGERLHRT